MSQLRLKQKLDMQSVSATEMSEADDGGDLWEVLKFLSIGTRTLALRRGFLITLVMAV